MHGRYPPRTVGRRPALRRRRRGEGVISAAIAVLIMAFLGAPMWVGFRAIWDDSEDNIREQTEQIGQDGEYGTATRGAGLLGSVAGLVVFLCLLTVALQVLVQPLQRVGRHRRRLRRGPAGRQRRRAAHRPAARRGRGPRPLACSGGSATTRPSSGTTAIPTSSSSASSPRRPGSSSRSSTAPSASTSSTAPSPCGSSSSSRDRAAAGRTATSAARSAASRPSRSGSSSSSSARCSSPTRGRWSTPSSPSSSAAREAARTYVEADSADEGVEDGSAAAREAMANHGRRAPVEVTFDEPADFTRCAQVVARVSYEVPAVPLPWIGGLGTTTVSARHSERIDPFRDGIPGEAECPP